MLLLDKIQKDMYSAMKAKDSAKAKTLRGAIAKLKDKRIAKREDLTEAEELKVLQSLAKQRKESIDMFQKGGRDDLVNAETVELKILDEYLPKLLGDAEIKTLIKNIVNDVCAESLADIGKVMPLIMWQGAGKIDGKKAQLFLWEILQG